MKDPLTILAEKYNKSSKTEQEGICKKLKEDQEPAVRRIKMPRTLVKRIACVACQYEFYAHFIQGYIQEKPWSWNVKQQVADQLLLAVLTLRQQGGTSACLL